MVKPSQVKIGPFLYKILWSEKSWQKYAPTEYKDKSHRGLTDPDAHHILIQGWGTSEDGQKETLLHELIHACLSVVGFAEIIKEVSKASVDVEEIAVRCLSPFLQEMLKENPKVVEYLLDD